MSNFLTRRINVTKLQHGVANLMFSIDSPRTEDVTLFTSSMLKLSGWALYNNRSVDVAIKHHSVEEVFKCERVRNDVLKNLNIEADARCGFFIPITFSGSFDVGFVINNTVVWGARVDIRPAEKVQFGKSGHLFLDNDHNKSVAQFTGHELISDDNISSWKKYFLKLNEYTSSCNSKHLFTLAPAKELVLPQYYPHKKSDITPVEQFLIHFHDENIIYPKDALSDAGDSTYSKHDTHWTDFGAGVATNYILSRIGISLNDPFPFPYRFIKSIGDLGIKISKTTIQEIMKADFSSARSHKIFDNKINNRGLIQVYHNPTSAIEKSVVVFGDSFSHNMIPYFVNAFSRVVFVLSGANVDYDILNNERPDFVICELTTRFLVQAPESNYSVSSDCKRKILIMSSSEQADFIATLRKTNNECWFFAQKTIADFDEQSIQLQAG